MGLACRFALNVLLRDKYFSLTAVSIGAGCGTVLFVRPRAHNHWLYNPLLYQLWKYEDLNGGASGPKIFIQRIYVLAVASALSLPSHIFPASPRKIRERVAVCWAGPPAQAGPS